METCFHIFPFRDWRWSRMFFWFLLYGMYFCGKVELIGIRSHWLKVKVSVERRFFKGIEVSMNHIVIWRLTASHLVLVHTILLFLTILSCFILLSWTKHAVSRRGDPFNYHLMKGSFVTFKLSLWIKARLKAFLELHIFLSSMFDSGFI